MCSLDDSPSLHHVYLLVGQGGIFLEPTLVQTVLGSCVAVTMHCAQRRWGGIFHALMPRMEECRTSPEPGDHFRCVDSAIMYLLHEYAKAGVVANELECKVFGGGSPLRHSGPASVGERNVRVALETLKDMNARVVATSLGGYEGRKLLFRTDTGVVLQKRFSIRSDNSSTP